MLVRHAGPARNHPSWGTGAASGSLWAQDKLREELGSVQIRFRGAIAPTLWSRSAIGGRVRRNYDTRRDSDVGQPLDRQTAVGASDQEPEFDHIRSVFQEIPTVRSYNPQIAFSDPSIQDKARIWAKGVSALGSEPPFAAVGTNDR